MKTISILTFALLLALTSARADSAANLFLNADFADGFANWSGYQGGPDGKRQIDPDTFVVLKKGEVTITPLPPTGNIHNLYQRFGQRRDMNPPLAHGVTYQFEVDFVSNTSGTPNLAVMIAFYDAEYKSLKQEQLPLIQKAGKTTSVQFSVPEGVGVVHVGVSCRGSGKWPGEPIKGSYTVKNFHLKAVPAKK